MMIFNKSEGGKRAKKAAKKAAKKGGKSNGIKKIDRANLY